MGGLYTPFKDFQDGAFLLESDLDGLQAYLIAQHIPTMIDDYSATVGEMQTTADPGEVGTESLATSLAGEIARLRQIIKEITGGAQWYSSPAASLAKRSISLSRQAFSVGTDADLNEKILGTYTLPAGKLAVNYDALKVRASVVFAGNGNAKTAALRFNGIGGTVIAVGVSAWNNQGAVLDALVMRIDATHVATNGYIISPSFNDMRQNDTATHTLSNAITIVLTGTNGVASANDIVGKSLEVVFMGAP